MKLPSSRAGFTAIEMVSAITILMLIMAAVAAIFNKSNQIWSRSGGGERQTRSARHALDLMARDLRHAVVDLDLPFVVRKAGTNSNYGWSQDELIFATHRDDGDPTNRAISVVWYSVHNVEAEDDDGPSRIELVRSVCTVTNVDVPDAADNFYWLTNAVDDLVFEDVGVLVDNVTAFWISVTRPDGELDPFYDAHDPESVGMPGGTDGSAAQRAVEGRLPNRLDIFIEVIDQETAQQVSVLDDERQGNLIDRKATRLTAAVAFPTRYASERGR